MTEFLQVAASLLVYAAFVVAVWLRAVRAAEFYRDQHLSELDRRTVGRRLA